MRELRIVLLVFALVVGSLEVLVYALRLPPGSDASTAAAAPLVEPLGSGLSSAAAALVEPPGLAPSVMLPDPVCTGTVIGHYAQIGYLQSVPVESPCD